MDVVHVKHENLIGVEEQMSMWCQKTHLIPVVNIRMMYWSAGIHHIDSHTFRERQRSSYIDRGTAVDHENCVDLWKCEHMQYISTKARSYVG